MVGRIQKLSKFNSLLLFGARGCGKSTLLRELFDDQGTLWIDLLRAEDEDSYRRNPDELSKQIERLKPKRVVIDEIQKIPKLLDVVHREIERNKKTQFILTGSSARKLKRGSANLLAGRAFSFHLFPLTTSELGDLFDLDNALHFGSLPALLQFGDASDKVEYLRTYARTYLKEEILQEQLIRNLDPFQNFLEIAAQSNGRILSYSKIARDLGVDDKTVQNYYSILADTYVGFFLEPFHRSIRKRQKVSPKFYLFDLGVKRALERNLTVQMEARSYAYGEAFETWIVQECFRLNEYGRHDFKLSYLRTQADVEVDLIFERPGKKDLLVEIKSTSRLQEQDASSLARIAADWDRPCEAQVWSLDPREKNIGTIACLPWRAGLDGAFRTARR